MDNFTVIYYINNKTGLEYGILFDLFTKNIITYFLHYKILQKGGVVFEEGKIFCGSVYSLGFMYCFAIWRKAFYCSRVPGTYSGLYR